MKLVDKTVKVSVQADTSDFVSCPTKVYQAWIDRVHENGTPVAVGDTYVWFYIQLFPPKWINCLITVQVGDEYPPMPPMPSAPPTPPEL